MADYGFTAAFLKAHPDVKKKVDEAVAGDWEMDKFLDALKTTGWWRTKTDSQRRYDIMGTDNPKELGELVRRAQGVIGRMAIQMGMNITSRDRIRFAQQYVRNGMTDAELRYMIGTYYKHGGNTGLIGQSRAELTKLAGDYGLKVTTTTVNNQIETILQGVRTVADYATFYRDIAKKTFAGVADQLDAGFTIRQIMDPYLATAAQELGKNPAALDISDSLWNRALTYKGANGTEAPREMDMDEWTRTIRTDTRYGWDQGEVAQKSASQFTQGLAQMFGAMG